jgi:catechol 2,3-dioxygenase-like lactoylglutathione lyase family enzyme
MSIALNHTIVWCRDQRASAAFLTDLFGLPDAVHWGPFMIVEVANGLSLDYHEVERGDDIASQHYAFLVSDDEFDEIFGRIVARGMQHWADPAKRHAGEINHNDGGRGVYFDDPDGHVLEIITRPYGSGAATN